MRNNDAHVDDITIEEDAMEQEVRPKLELNHLVPDFKLESVDGKRVSPTDYKERKSLVILFFNPRNSCDLEMLAEVRHRYEEFADSNAEVLAIASGPMEEVKDCMNALNLPFPLLHDANKEAICAYCVTESMVFVADKYGELKMQGSLCGAIDETLDQVASALELIELECPECGVPTWPKF